jgi:hypothetical protein
MAYSSIRGAGYRYALVLSVFAATLLGAARLAEARSAGIASTEFTVPGNGCHNCHVTNPGVAPNVSLMADDTSLTAGQQITLTFTVTSGAPVTQTHAGFNIRADKEGVFATGGPSSSGTRTITGANGWLEATHSGRKMNDAGGVAIFTILWTPSPGTSGAVNFTAWGNSVNFMNGNQGDRANTDSLAITVAGCVPTTWYRDADGDSYGSTSTTTSSCAQPGGYVANSTDCNDGAAGIHPGAAEVCNGIDEDCDATADDGLATTTFYKDNDNDSYGAQASGTKVACNLAQAGAGYSASNTDCNDGAAGVNPGAAETCNGVDDNCNGTVDNDTPGNATFYRDVDGDGFGAAGSGTAVACTAPTGYVNTSTDCDDSAVGVKPGATEVCNNRDDDCDGTPDDNLGMMTCGTAPCVTVVPACLAGVPQTCTPVCPPDAGTDAAPDTAPDSTPDMPPADVPPVDAPSPGDTAGDIRIPDAPPPGDTPPASDTATPDSAPASDTRPPDTGSTADAGTADTRPADTRDGGTRAAGGEGCDCRIGSDRSAGNALAPVLIAGLLSTLVYRRRRRR